MMNSNASDLARTPRESLWTRAPLWRLCVLVAMLSTGVVVCFPPKWRAPDATLASVPEAATYHPLQPAVEAPAARPATTVAESKPVDTMADSKANSKADSNSNSKSSSKADSASAAQKQRPADTQPQSVANTTAKLTPKASTSTTVAANPVAKAPTTAAISMAVPGAAARPDISGLNGALLGRTYRQSIRVEGFDIPLPPGQWAVLANSSIHFNSTPGMAYFLGRIEQKRLVGAIRLFALRSTSLPGTGFPAANGCKAGNPNLNYLYAGSVTAFDHQACWLINNYFTPPLQQWADRAVKIAGLDRAAAGDLTAKGVSYPQDLVDVRFTRAETWGLLEVSYLFNPETEGINSGTALSARESDWHAPNAPRFPEKMAYLAKMQEWGEGFWPKFQQAFESGQPTSLPANPDPASQN